VAEIGINHNGDIDIAKKLIDVAKESGCDYVKFQKRTPEICVPENQKNILKDTLWGKITYLEYKNKIEFNVDQYKDINNYCKNINIKWFVSVWDINSAEQMKQFGNLTKIPSALITDDNLLNYARNNYDKLILSTGMSTEKEIEHAVEISNPDIIFHSNSSYPTPLEEINLGYIEWLKNKYYNKEIGFSSHDLSNISPILSITKGITWFERHITLDNSMWGSDQKSSIEPNELKLLIKNIRETEIILSNQYIVPRSLSKSELTKKESLRK